MKILFIGNSITQGVVGESFVKLIALENPSYVIKNCGIGGYRYQSLKYDLINGPGYINDHLSSIFIGICFSFW
jgi:hypothetical protein